jgi:thiol-disulfide isomerase/thioredoxin
MRTLAAAAALCSLVACTGGAGVPEAGPDGLFAPNDRPAAPVLSGPAVSGAPVPASRGAGRVLVVNFWGSWCGPCRGEAGELAAVSHQTTALGVVFLGVDEKEDRSAAARFEQVRRTPYPSLFDKGGVILTKFRRLAPQQTPTTILIDRRGRIARVLPGGITASELLPLVTRLAGER